MIIEIPKKKTALALWKLCSLLRTSAHYEAFQSLAVEADRLAMQLAAEGGVRYDEVQQDADDALTDEDLTALMGRVWEPG